MTAELIVGLIGALTTGLVVAVQAAFHRCAAARPHRVDNPGDGPHIVTLAAVLDQLERAGSTVAAEFRPPPEHVDTRTFATGGVLLVPDDVDVDQLRLPAGAMVVRTSRPQDVRHIEVGPAGVVPAGTPKPVTPVRSWIERRADRIADDARRHAPRGRGYLSADRPVDQLPRVRRGPGPGGRRGGQVQPDVSFPPPVRPAPGLVEDLTEQRRGLAVSIRELHRALLYRTTALARSGRPSEPHDRHARQAFHRWSNGVDPTPSIDAAAKVARRGHRTSPEGVAMLKAIAADWQARQMLADLRRPDPLPNPGRAALH